MTTTQSDASTRPYHSTDISSDAFWKQRFHERDKAFADLRKSSTVTWHQPLAVPYPHDEKGFWAVTRHEDIAHVSMNHELFSSGQGVGVGPMPLEFEQLMSFFLAMDPPQHTLFRRTISSAFTPRQVKKIEEIIESNARDIVDGIIGAGEFDFMDRVAGVLPMHTISDIVGVPRSEREAVAKAAGHIIANDTQFDNPEEAIGFMLENVQYLHQVGADLAAHRRKHPGDDLFTNIVQAEYEGQSLTNEHIGAFMILLATAGNDTTKQTTAHTIKALQDNPDQRAWLMEDFEGRIRGSVEEFVRNASPVIAFARRATQDTRIGDQDIAKGEKVAVFYCSGNRDETVFDRPAEFDLSRNPNPHQGFGGGGIHYCLGNTVAKTQLRSIFRELLTRVPDIEVGEPTYLESNFVHGITKLPVRV